MDKKWLIIGGILVVLLIAFGKNPVGEKRKQRELERQGKDPLMESINEFTQGGSRRGGFRGTTIERPGPADGEPIAPAGSFGSRNTNTPTYMLRNRNYNNYGDRPPADPYQGQPPAQQQLPAQDNYYPPPPLNSNPMGPRSSNHTGPSLSDGRPVLFAGTEVYTYDPSGKAVPMPDGVYPIYDGQINLVIRGGRSVVIK